VFRRTGDPWPTHGGLQEAGGPTLSRPTGPRLVFRMLATACTAIVFCVRTSCPVVRSPFSCSCGADDIAATRPRMPAPLVAPGQSGGQAAASGSQLG
jgi:hypothetical protein